MRSDSVRSPEPEDEDVRREKEKLLNRNETSIEESSFSVVIKASSRAQELDISQLPLPPRLLHHTRVSQASYWLVTQSYAWQVQRAPVWETRVSQGFVSSRLYISAEEIAMKGWLCPALWPRISHRILTLSPPRGRPLTSKIGVRQSKIYKSPLVVKGLTEIVFNPFTTKGSPFDG